MKHHNAGGKTRSIRAGLLFLVAHLVLFAGRGEAAIDCLFDFAGADRWYLVSPVQVRTELIDASGRRFGKREVAPGESTEICIGFEPHVHLPEPDEGGVFGTDVRVFIEQQGLAFSSVQCRKPGTWPCLGGYSRLFACEELGPPCNYFLALVYGGTSWDPPDPGDKPWPRDPADPDVSYLCCQVTVSPKSRPGLYTVGCSPWSCCGENDACERTDACTQAIDLRPVRTENQPLRCCCCPPCQADTLRVVPCVGDCSRDGTVTVEEILRGVAVALGEEDAATCEAADGNGDGLVGIDELVRAVRNALSSCVETAREDRESNSHSASGNDEHQP